MSTLLFFVFTVFDSVALRQLARIQRAVRDGRGEDTVPNQRRLKSCCVF